jgi:hypothetical protein
MAYMNQEKKKIIKANLDKILKPLGIKYSLRVRDNMSINCIIKSAPIDLIGNFNHVMMTSDAWREMSDILKERDYVSVNPYWYQDHYTGESKELLGKVLEALRSADYYDRSDAQVDYFDCAYYYGLSLGDYKTPFKYTGE